MHKTLALAFALLVAPASAQLIEGFEHGNELLYAPINVGNDTLDFTVGAAHDGNLGAQFNSSLNPTWRARFDLVTSAGNTYDCFVRLRGSSTTGRSYVGYGATANGCLTAVIAPNTGQILLQSCTNWNFNSLASAPFQYSADTWYVLRLEWAANGDASVHLLDETRTTTLASTPTVATPFVSSGGIALRGSSNNAPTVFHDLDTIWLERGNLGTNYCSPGVANSTGHPGVITAFGRRTVAGNDVTLRAQGLPSNAFGYFLTSRTQGSLGQPGGSLGVLCLGGSIGRYVGPGQIKNTGDIGEFSLVLDLTQTPTPTGPVSIAPGETWNFQSWHRDAVGGAATSNFTNGLSVTLQ